MKGTIKAMNLTQKKNFIIEAFALKKTLLWSFFAFLEVFFSVKTAIFRQIIRRK
jgi:hypothetical protein